MIFFVDVLSVAGSRASARSISPGGSIHTITDIASLASSVKAMTADGKGFSILTPQQLGVLGI